MKQFFKWLLLASCPVILTNCGGTDHDDKDDEPEISTEQVAETIVGNWLLSTSDSVNWVAYEFTSSAHVNARNYQDGKYYSESGYYWIKDNTVTGNYNTDNGRTFYLDWIVNSVKPFEIGLDIYDDTDFVGKAALYRIIGELTVEEGKETMPDYRSLCGTADVSDFKAIDESIVKVDAQTGQMTGLAEGSTFVTFSVPDGTVVAEVSVTEGIKTFAEMVVGTWIYDSPKTKTWESYTYNADGFYSIQWQTFDAYHLNESAQGNYTIDGESVVADVKSSSGMLYMKFVNVSISKFDWTYKAYDYKSNHLNGQFTAQRLLESYTMKPNDTVTPEYRKLVGNAIISGYSSHAVAIATVNDSGEITAVKKGRTYIDVKTDQGSGVVEINVEQ